MSEGLVNGRPKSAGLYSVQYMGRWWQVEVVEDMTEEGVRLVVLGLPGFEHGQPPDTYEFASWGLCGDYMTASQADMLSPSDRAIARLVAAYQHAQYVAAHTTDHPVDRVILDDLGPSMLLLRETLGEMSESIPAITEQIEWWGFADREAVHARVKKLRLSEQMYEAEEKFKRDREASAQRAKETEKRMKEQERERETAKDRRAEETEEARQKEEFLKERREAREKRLADRFEKKENAAWEAEKQRRAEAQSQKAHGSVGKTEE